ncbi:hypothetical protein OGZ02_17185 [Brachyspira hyodysenteriae]|nr:hypothetical protein [Brachyspira hyodysenteriae]MDA1470479.1 hypothetical protein [Brachyspira hyodysenteriae]
MIEKEASFRLFKHSGLFYSQLELLKTQSVFDNVSLPLKFLNESSSNINKKVNEILENLKIDNLKRKTRTAFRRTETESSYS